MKARGPQDGHDEQDILRMLRLNGGCEAGASVVFVKRPPRGQHTQLPRPVCSASRQHQPELGMERQSAV